MAEKSKIHLIKQLLDTAENSLFSAKQILSEIEGIPSKDSLKIREKAKNLHEIEPDKVIEGIFDGENMVGPDGTTYPVPPNYASKSKLIEGDTLKLTIDPSGSFIFKQIKPAERKIVIGSLIEEEGEYRVLSEGRFYKVLLASITYFKAKPGDEITLQVPKDKDSQWGAVEHVVKKSE